MGRPLTIALAQYAPLAGTDPVAALHRHGAEMLAATPALGLIAFPEIHLLGGCDTADDPNEWPTAAAEPLDGPRMAPLSRVAADLGVWLIPGSVAELGDDARVREKGTEGFNRMWSQMAPDDLLIDLPIYSGGIDPTRWQPKGTT
jgi:predicted amidohydrolase